MKMEVELQFILNLPFHYWKEMFTQEDGSEFEEAEIRKILAHAISNGITTLSQLRNYEVKE